MNDALPWRRLTAAEKGSLRLLVCAMQTFSGWRDERPYAGFHDGRHYQSLPPWCCRRIVNGWKHSGSAYWDFYKQLFVYRQDQPGVGGAVARESFDELFFHGDGLR